MLRSWSWTSPTHAFADAAEGGSEPKGRKEPIATSTVLFLGGPVAAARPTSINTHLPTRRAHSILPYKNREASGKHITLPHCWRTANRPKNKNKNKNVYLPSVEEGWKRGSKIEQCLDW